MAKQIDIYGNLTELPPEPKKGGRKKYASMQSLHGVTEGKTCKTCNHLLCYENWNSKRFYKCELWHISNSAATDIRLKNKACGKYEEETQ